MRENDDVTASHAERYRLVEEPALRRVETRVFGSDYGATSYTNRAQADRIADLLELASGKVFLDVGSGTGWPGIHLGASTGARAVLTDIPREGLEVASRRLARDGVDGHVVLASGDALPFGDQTFDAVTSSDALC